MVDPRAAPVAARAAELALAAGVDLPDDLALWHLAGGRPRATAVPGRPEELGTILEAALEPRARQARGAHYTPEDLAREVVALALVGHRDPAVCDPACGGGALLLAAARHLAAAGAEPASVVERLWGVDIDPLAVATTEVALWLWARRSPEPGHLLVADLLDAPPPLPLFDAVVGNPPFLSQLGASTARSALEADRLRERFDGAVRAYTDPAGLFLVAACALARPGGTVAMVQPQSLLAARDAAGVRTSVEGVATVREVWVPARRPFRAAVEVCVPVLEVGAGASSGGRWSAHLARAQGVPQVALSPIATVGDEAEVGAAFREEYYGMAPHVHEVGACPAGRPLLTAGLVDVGRSAWGERPARIGGRRWDRPVVDAERLSGRAAAWARRTAAPKLVIATQTAVVEAVVDDVGTLLPGVPLIVAWPAPDRLWPLAAALCSPAVTAWAAERVAGTALTARSLKLTASIVREVPLPVDLDAWEAGTTALRAGDLQSFAEAMTAAYACDRAVAVWWLDRAGSAWSLRGSSR